MISAVVLVEVGAQKNGLPEAPSAGNPALHSLLENAIHSELDEIICVVRGLALLRPQLAVADEKIFWLLDYGADRGKSHSMIAGLWTIHPQSAGVLFLLENETAISRQLIDALIDRFESSNAWIVAPSADGQMRQPLLFRRELFPELLKLTGDRVGLELVEKHHAKTALIEWRDEMPTTDRIQRRQLHDLD
jgi:CTP:molybdopterin cytidylyltransferase MocA